LKQSWGKMGDGRGGDEGFRGGEMGRKGARKQFGSKPRRGGRGRLRFAGKEVDSPDWRATFPERGATEKEGSRPKKTKVPVEAEGLVNEKRNI